MFFFAKEVANSFFTWEDEKSITNKANKEEEEEKEENEEKCGSKYGNQNARIVIDLQSELAENWLIFFENKQRRFVLMRIKLDCYCNYKNKKKELKSKMNLKINLKFFWKKVELKKKKKKEKETRSQIGFVSQEQIKEKRAHRTMKENWRK